MPAILFAHFRTRIPKHLKLNLERTTSLFPDSRVILLTDQVDLRNIDSKVEVVYQQPLSSAASLLDSSSHPMSFRNGFWFTTFFRILAVAEFVISTGLSVIHVESDVILAQDFPFNKFKDLNKPISYPIVSARCGVASTLYIRDAEAALMLCNSIGLLSQSDSKLTDMTFLRKFYDLNPDIVSPLPSGPIFSTSFHNSVAESYREALSNSFVQLGGYFDTVDLGFFLTGEDPRNHRGIRRLRTTDLESDLNVSQLNFKWDETRDFISVASKTGTDFVPLYSLHVHSKDLRIFELNDFSRILRNRIKNQNKSTGYEFVFKVFLRQTMGSITRRLKVLMSKILK